MGILLKGARVLSPGDGIDKNADVLIEDGLVKQLGQIDPKGHQLVDLSGLVLTPGLIDIHAHLREPGQEYKETIETGAKAALRGGYTTVVAMPNTLPPIDTPEQVEFVLERAKRADAARVLPAGAITKGRQGKELAEMLMMARAGAVMFTDDGDWIQDSSVMRRAMEYSLAIDTVISTHAQDKTLSENAHAHEGPLTLELGMITEPREAEDIAVARDIFLAGLTGARLHIQHLSSVGSVELLRRAKDVGLRVTGEATPHHLLFTYDELASFDTVWKVNPPLREEKDRQALLQALIDGAIDAIATDHAPHSAFDKEYEFPYAPSGMMWLEIAFSALYTLLVEPGHLSLHRLVEALTKGPARVLGREDMGCIKPGCPADLVAWDLSQEWEVKDLCSRSSNNPLVGKTLKARAKRVWIHGKDKEIQ